VSHQKVQFQNEDSKVVDNLYVQANSEDRPLSAVLVAGAMMALKNRWLAIMQNALPKLGIRL
jgi:hypothetical protein